MLPRYGALALVLFYRLHGWRFASLWHVRLRLSFSPPCWFISGVSNACPPVFRPVCLFARYLFLSLSLSLLWRFRLTRRWKGRALPVDSSHCFSGLVPAAVLLVSWCRGFLSSRESWTPHNFNSLRGSQHLHLTVSRGVCRTVFAHSRTHGRESGRDEQPHAQNNKRPTMVGHAATEITGPCSLNADCQWNAFSTDTYCRRTKHRIGPFGLLYTLITRTYVLVVTTCDGLEPFPSWFVE